MVQKRIDNRIRVLIDNGVKLGHRTLFVILGEKGKDQVPLLYNIFTKAMVKVKPSVLWCYKSKLEVSSNRKKRMKQLKHKAKLGSSEVNENDHFDNFMNSNSIRFCYYKETNKILGQTFGMLVLQDFECMTPNLLARTIETVEGGGLIVILMSTITSLRQLHTINMDVHENYKTEAHRNVVPRFNKRFLLSLVSCERSLVIDDRLTVLPITSQNLEITPVETAIKKSKNEEQLAEVKQDMRDAAVIGGLVNCCKTLDQAKALDVFISAITEKTLSSIVSLTAARGRGKSAALGLAVAAAIGFGYTNIFVTSPSPENLNTFFEFVRKGFEALEYMEHSDYSVVRSANQEFNKAVVRINVYKEHRQTIQYIHPTDSEKLSQCELLVIDEAAAIPLPFVKKLFGKYLVFLASTINGYEGTGRSLSLKLLKQLRVQVIPTGSNSTNSATGKTLKEVTLEESIRYKPGDAVEAWLTKLLCLDVTSVPIHSGFPSPRSCDLYYINRDALFCYNAVYEIFLQRLVSLFVASHYKNSPDDLLLMSDAPAYHLFCLCGPNASPNTLPEVLVAVLICLEGQLSKNSISQGTSSRNMKPYGDTIPWKVMEQFQDTDFGTLPGARIVRIATHPDCQKMGYGTRALTLLRQYYEFKFPLVQDLVENVSDDSEQEENEPAETRKGSLKLILRLQERKPETLSYMGVSYGLTEPLLKFWKQSSFVPVYVCQTTNDLTGEHSCIMLSPLKNEENERRTDDWLFDFYADFRRRFVSLLGFEFSKFSTSLALGMLKFDIKETATQNLTLEELNIHITKYEMKRLEMHNNSVVDLDYHLIMDLVPAIAKLFYLNKMGSVEISEMKSRILLGVGLQHKSLENLETELDLQENQGKSFLDRAIKQSYEYLNSICQADQTIDIPILQPTNLVPLVEDLKDELEEAAKELEKKQKKELQTLKIENLQQFAIKGSEEEWNQALTLKGNKSFISIKGGKKRLNESAEDEKDDNQQVAKKKKDKKKHQRHK